VDAVPFLLGEVLLVFFFTKSCAMSCIEISDESR